MLALVPFIQAVHFRDYGKAYPEYVLEIGCQGVGLGHLTELAFILDAIKQRDDEVKEPLMLLGVPCSPDVRPVLMHLKAAKVEVEPDYACTPQVVCIHVLPFEGETFSKFSRWEWPALNDVEGEPQVDDRLSEGHFAQSRLYLLDELGDEFEPSFDRVHFTRRVSQVSPFQALKEVLDPDAGPKI